MSLNYLSGDMLPFLGFLFFLEISLCFLLLFYRLESIY